MRIVVMGTGPFAVPMFAAILSAGHEVPALFTRPVPPASGRKKESLQPNPMRDFAELGGIPVHAPETTRSAEVQTLLRSYSPDLLAVCDFGEILSPEALACSPLGGINLHASLLPKYRGAAPINWAILKGEKETGVSVIHMTPKLDGGPILAVARTPIGPTETSAELEPRLAQLGVQPVLDSIELLSRWDRTSPIGTPQDLALASQARRLRKTDGNVAWKNSAARIHRQQRGLQPWPGLFTHYLKPSGQPLRIILDKVSLAKDLVRSDLAPGQAALVEPARLLVQTGNGLLSLDRVQPAGKKVMEVGEFLRGHKVQVGEWFGDPG